MEKSGGELRIGAGGMEGVLRLVPRWVLRVGISLLFDGVFDDEYVF